MTDRVCDPCLASAKRAALILDASSAFQIGTAKSASVLQSKIKLGLANETDCGVCQDLSWKWRLSPVLDKCVVLKSSKERMDVT